MPAYNVERFIADAIQSILDQTFRDFELIIVDDRSLDATPAIIRSFAARDARIRCHFNTEHVGLLPNALNRAAALARGDLIARMDADDVALPHRLQKQVEFLSLHPDIGVVGGGIVIVDEGGKTIGERRYWLEDAAIRKNLFFCSPFCGASIMMHRSLLERVGGFDPAYPVCEDYDLFLRLGKVTKFANLGEQVYRYRVRPDSLSHSRGREMERKTIAIRRKHFEAYGASVIPRLFTLFHSLSLYVLPFSWKAWLFEALRKHFP